MLDAGALVDTATAQTGLTEFGAPGWREGLDRLIDSLNGEAGLTALGEQTL